MKISRSAAALAITVASNGIVGALASAFAMTGSGADNSLDIPSFDHSPIHRLLLPVRDTCPATCLPKLCTDEVTLKGTNTLLTYLCPPTPVASISKQRSTVIVTVTEYTTVTPTEQQPVKTATAGVSASVAEPTTTITIINTSTSIKTITLHRISSSTPDLFFSSTPETTPPTYPDPAFHQKTDKSTFSTLRPTGTSGVFPYPVEMRNSTYVYPTVSGTAYGVRKALFARNGTYVSSGSGVRTGMATDEALVTVTSYVPLVTSSGKAIGKGHTGHGSASGSATAEVVGKGGAARNAGGWIYAVFMGLGVGGVTVWG